MEIDRDAEKIYQTLYAEQPYKSPIDGQIIPFNNFEVIKYRNHLKKIKTRVDRQFTRLAREFDDFIQNKYIYLNKKSTTLVPIKGKPGPRTGYNRSSKTGVDYAGSTTGTTGKKHKKKKSKKINRLETDQINMVTVFIIS